MGLVPEDVNPHPVSAEDSPEWSAMTPEQRAKSCRAMECFAGMVECIDANVGKVGGGTAPNLVPRYLPANFFDSLSIR